MKLELLVRYQKSLAALAVAPITDAQTAWNLSEELDKVSKALERYNAKRDELIKKHGKPEKEDGKFFIANTEKFNEEILKLEAVDVKVSFPKITVPLLGKAVLSAADINGLRELKILTK